MTLSVLLLVLISVMAALVVIIILLFYKLWTRCRDRRVRDKAAEQQRRRLLASINALPRGKYQRCEVCPSPTPSLVLAPLLSHGCHSPPCRASICLLCRVQSRAPIFALP